MSATFPPDLQRFIEDELASGRFESESELLIRALSVYRELKTRHNQLREDVRASIAAAERGDVSPLDFAEIKATVRKLYDSNSAVSE